MDQVCDHQQHCGHGVIATTSFLPIHPHNVSLYNYIINQHYHLCLWTGIENGKREVPEENGILQVDSALQELSNETKEDSVIKQENQSTKNELVANEDAVYGHPCGMKNEGPTAIIQPGQPLFLLRSWRTQLCRCPTCLRMYSERAVDFLLDSDDTLQVLPIDTVLLNFYMVR